VDVYLEPHAPARLLLVVGFTPVAEAVAQMGALLELEVVHVVNGSELRDLQANSSRVIALSDLPAFLETLSEPQRSQMAAVVASQGHYDEPALEPLLNAGVGFVGLLASRKRAVTVRELLELQGMSAERAGQIRNPVGLNINAKTPAEVAISILAEIIAARGESGTAMFTNSSGYDAEQHRSSLTDANVGAQRASHPCVQGTTPLHQLHRESEGSTISSSENAVGMPSTRPGFAVSPVDGEEIEIASAVHFAALNGKTYYFTCANCKRRFLKGPESYLQKLEPTLESRA
jgi:xanthine dehydrogenase accessory factor